MSNEEIKEMDVSEFRREGYLQELNRQFLHPLGLALEVVVEEDGTERLGRIWDYRDDPEGMNYHKSMDLSEKAANISRVVAERAPARLKKLGYWVQPEE